MGWELNRSFPTNLKIHLTCILSNYSVSDRWKGFEPLISSLNRSFPTNLKIHLTCILCNYLSQWQMERVWATNLIFKLKKAPNLRLQPQLWFKARSQKKKKRKKTLTSAKNQLTVQSIQDTPWLHVPIKLLSGNMM